MPAMKKPFSGRGEPLGGDATQFLAVPAHTYRKIVGDRVRELRERKGLTQREFGKLMGLSNNMISAVELGATTIRPERYAEFADLLGVSRVSFGKLLLRNYDPWLFGMIYGEGTVENDIAQIRPRGKDDRD